MGKIKEIDRYIKQLLKNKIDYYDIPEEITEDDEFILKAKDNGIIFFARRGYDVINNNFFVEQYINDGDRSYNEGIKTFKTFEEYYNLLKGDIYDNSCYYQYRFSSLQVKEYGLDIERLNADHFIDYTIDDWTCCVPSRDKNDDNEDNKIELKEKTIDIMINLLQFAKILPIFSIEFKIKADNVNIEKYLLDHVQKEDWEGKQLSEEEISENYNYKISNFYNSENYNSNGKSILKFIKYFTVQSIKYDDIYKLVSGQIEDMPKDYEFVGEIKLRDFKKG